MKNVMAACGALVVPMALADVVVVGDSPSVVRCAEVREAIRQDTTWTAENIRKNPYLFLQDQIQSCDRLRDRIDAQNIVLIRMEKKANRAVEEARGLQARYEKFLNDVKTAYKAANGKWPITVNGYDLDEDEMNEKIDDAMTRVEMAKNEQKDNAVVAKKVSTRKSVLKNKKRELMALRTKLGQQAEQVRLNAELEGISDLQASLGTIKDMMIEIDEDPAKMSVEDLTAEDPKTIRSRRVENFLND